MSTDKISLVKTLMGIGADSAITMAKGLNAVGVVSPVVPDALETIKNYLSPAPETPPATTDEIIETLKILKGQHPDVYEKLIALFNEKA